MLNAFQASFLSKSSKPKISAKTEGSNATSTIITPTTPDRPVECTICSRKFKNIPALNGHMRLHGGYYKKDADGKRIAPQDASGPQRLLAEESAIRKRKQDGVSGKRSQVPPISSSNINGINGDAPSRLSESPPHKRLFLERESGGDSIGQSESAPAFRCLPPPDTSQLLANLERKTKEEQQAAVAAVAAAAVQLPTPPPPPAPALAPLPPFSVSVHTYDSI